MLGGLQGLKPGGLEGALRGAEAPLFHLLRATWR